MDEHAAPLDRGNIAAALLWAADWCNDALLEALVEAGYRRFTTTQALVFARLGTDGRTAADLARDIGITRQSMQQVVAPLLADGLLVATPDPDDGRARLLRLGPRGEQLSADATALLGGLWGELESRIGVGLVAALREVLAAPWGPTPSLTAGARPGPR